MHIQIISYNSTTFFYKLITSLNIIKRNGNDDIVVHFLENSDKKTQPELEKLMPLFEFTFDQSPSNLGFARGHNFLFNKYNETYGEEFMIMNPDTVLFYDIFDQIKKFKSKIGSNWGIIEPTQFPKEHPKDFEKDFSTEWASCAGAVMKTKTFKDLFGFDENIFMYCEDVDFSWRVREMGQKVYHCPYAKFAHITRDLDLEKDPTFEQTNTLAGNLYLRYKYFDENKVNNYLKLMVNNPNYDAIHKLYKKMKENLKPDELKKYRSFKVPKIYPDENYDVHRW